MKIKINRNLYEFRILFWNEVNNILSCNSILNKIFIEERLLRFLCAIVDILSFKLCVFGYYFV